MVEALLPDLTSWWTWLLFLVVVLGVGTVLTVLVDQFTDLRAVVAIATVLGVLVVYVGMLLVHAYDLMRPFSARSAVFLTLVLVAIGVALALRGYGRLRRSDWDDEPVAGALALGVGGAAVALGIVLWCLNVLIDAANRAMDPITVGMIVVGAIGVFIYAAASKPN